MQTDINEKVTHNFAKISEKNASSFAKPLMFSGVELSEEKTMVALLIKAVVGCQSM